MGSTHGPPAGAPCDSRQRRSVFVRRRLGGRADRPAKSWCVLCRADHGAAAAAAAAAITQFTAFSLCFPPTGRHLEASAATRHLPERSSGIHTVTRALGSSGLQVTVLGQGCASLGDLYEKLNNAEALDAVAAAYARGIMFFDTSPFYGVGLSEARLGIALHGKPRTSFVLQTKVGGWGAPPVRRQMLECVCVRAQWRCHCACLGAAVRAWRRCCPGRPPPGPRPRRRERQEEQVDRRPPQHGALRLQRPRLRGAAGRLAPAHGARVRGLAGDPRSRADVPHYPEQQRCVFARERARQVNLTGSVCTCGQIQDACTSSHRVDCV